MITTALLLSATAAPPLELLSPPDSSSPPIAPTRQAPSRRRSDEADDLYDTLPLRAAQLLSDLELVDRDRRGGLTLSIDFGLGHLATIGGNKTIGWAQLVLDVPWERVLFPARPSRFETTALPAEDSTMSRHTSPLLPAAAAGALMVSVLPSGAAAQDQTPWAHRDPTPTRAAPRTDVESIDIVPPPIGANTRVSVPTARAPTVQATLPSLRPTTSTEHATTDARGAATASRAAPLLALPSTPVIVDRTADLVRSSLVPMQLRWMGPDTSRLDLLSADSRTAASPTPTSNVTPSPRPIPPTINLDPARTQTLVEAAWKVAGVDGDGRLDALGTRARWSALAPEVRLRASRGSDIGARLYLTGAELDKSSSTDATQTFLEARLAFRLDRLVFADEEVSLERLRLERLSIREKLAHRIAELTIRYRRAERASKNPSLDELERAEAAATATDALMMLDAHTGGVASSILSYPRAP